jgi:hypothetical protein
MILPALLATLALAAEGPIATAPPAPEAAPAAPAAAAAPDASSLPPGAPTEPYALTAWCYGALSEYLEIYPKVVPDLQAIDKLFGSSVKNEKTPYADDVAAARDEQALLSQAVTAAEQASAKSISDRGIEAIHAGRAIWGPAENKSRRELARAWLAWGLPEKCDTTAHDLIARSALLGQALKHDDAPTAPPPAPPPAAPPAPEAPPKP